MWHYNFDYLSHGTNGYKYIDKYRGKNGKWQYVYETPLQNMGRRAEYRINHPLSTSQKLLYPGQNKSVDEVGYGKRPTKKLSIRREVDNTSSSGGRGTNSKWTKVDAILEIANSEAAKPSTRKSEIRQKVDPAIDQKAREREIAKGKAAAKDYRQSKVTAKDVQREREREIKSGMSSNRQWNRDAISKGSSVEAAQKAREQGIASSKAATRQYDTSQGAKKMAELPGKIRPMVDDTKKLVKNIKGNFERNVAQKERAEEIAKAVDTIREQQRKKENSLGARIKRNIDDDVATAKALNDSKTKTPKEIIKNNARDIVEGKVNSMSKKEQQWANAAKQQEREHSRTTAAIDAQNARQRAIEASQARQRQAAAAKQQEEERKRAGRTSLDKAREAAKQKEAERRQAGNNKPVDRAQNAREAAIASSQARQRQAAAAKQQEAERRRASNNAERAQNARQKGMDESVRKTWEQKAKAEIKNKAQFDRKQDELIKLCKDFRREWSAEDENRNILGMRNWKKIDNQRGLAMANRASKIKDLASLLAASDVKALDWDTYSALSDALTAIRAYQRTYNYGGIDSKNNANTPESALHYKKDKSKDLVKIIEDVLEEAKLNEDYLYEDTIREELLREKKIK